LEKWYKYESQCWYRNTFLVNKPSEISFGTTQDNTGWNNVYDGGCHFVCLAMIIGINPAYLASVLGENTNYFTADKSIDSLHLNGIEGSLVWDQNKPDKKNPSIKLENIYHPKYGLTDIFLMFINIKKTNNKIKANKIIREAKSEDMHVICGYSDHSILVSGIKEDKYFLWDPDISPENKGLKEQLNGDYGLDKFYDKHSKEIENKELAEYWIYSVKYINFD